MQTILSVQVLRALAALAVVLCHYGLFYSQTTGQPGALASLDFGEAGVDLFFVISGFIMVYASDRLYGKPGAPLTFLAHRLIRIVPLYWLVTTLYVLIALLVPAAGKNYDLPLVLASYAFFPWPQSGGVMQPVVGQGWSLNYEMAFYLVFALALFASRRVAVLGASLALSAVVAAGIMFEPLNPVLKFLTSPIMLEFVIGMLIGLAYREGIRFPAKLGWGLVAAGLLLLLASRQTHEWLGGRLLPWGLPAMLAVAGATLGQVAASGTLWRGLVLVGEASYALYLTHTVAVRGTLYLMSRSGLDMTAMAWPGLIVATVASLAIAFAVYYAVEMPSKNALRKLYDGRRTLRKPMTALA